jgi:hypothetical protein|tara:strand:- start:2610 stop:2777 length:168 start_codon:yes stop_codon:yes gene_type:complete
VRNRGQKPQKSKGYKGNPVAKNMEKFNRPNTHVDKKKEYKNRGYESIDELYKADE